MKEFKILSDKQEEPKKNKKKQIIILSTASALIIIGISGFLIFKNRKPKDYAEYQEKAKIYQEQNIDYTYDDFKQDEKAIKEEQNKINNDKNNKNSDSSSNNSSGNSNDKSDSNKNLDSKKGENIAIAIQNENVSKATKQLLNKNEETLKELKKDTMVDTTLNDVANSIANQTKEMNNFIKNHCGYPDAEYPDKDFGGAKEFIDSVVNSMSGKGQFEPLYDMSVDQTQAEVRYSILENEQYNVGNGYTQYKQCLKNWMAMGHPEINSIDTISLTKVDTKENKDLFDGVYNNNLDAYIVSSGVKYKVYLSSQVVDGGKSYYKVLDIKKE